MYSRAQIEQWLERALPYLVGGMAIALAILIPMTIYTVKQVSSNKAQIVLDNVEDSQLSKEIRNLEKNLNNKITQLRLAKGEPGEKGTKGIKGYKGEIGSIGPVGPPGPKGSQGVKGEKGPKGSGDGEPGSKGDVGPKGEKGDKGAIPEPSGPIKKEISSASKGDKTTYLVSCISPCRDISINLRFTSGDADLYGSENSPPVIRNSDCDVNCSLCKSRDSDLSDRCNIRSTSGKRFYAMVVAHKDYRNATIVFDGLNLQNVTDYDG